MFRMSSSSGGKTRLDPRVEAEGAEFLVLGHLLLDGIHAAKAHTRYPGHYLIALNPVTGLMCRIQVRSRWATDYNRSFPLKANSACEFVVLAALNRGFRYRQRPTQTDDGRRPPTFFVFPTGVLNQLVRVSGGWSRVRLDDIPDVESYKERWDLIRQFLKLPAVAAPEEIGLNG